MTGYTGHARHLVGSLEIRETVPPALLDWIVGQAPATGPCWNWPGMWRARTCLVNGSLRNGCCGCCYVTPTLPSSSRTRCQHTSDAMLAAVVPTSDGIADQVEFSRKLRLQVFVGGLTGDARDRADLLLPTFTGWPADLAGLLQDLDG